MSGRVRSCSSHRRELLADDWEMLQADPAAASSTAPPDGRWLPATAPGTVASALRDAALWSFDSPPRAFDAEEWWFRRRFDAEPLGAGARLVLGLDGLATLAEVWLNGKLLCRSANMFVAHELDISHLVESSNELLIRFGQLQTFLATKRARARWRTPMVSHQQLRWLRTTLLGRTPGWSPPAAPVGPWRPVWLEHRRALEVGDSRLVSALDGRRGVLTLTGSIVLLGGASLESATFVVVRHGMLYSAPLDIAQGAAAIRGKVEVPDVEAWWPHTHGEPALYEVRLEFTVADSDGTRSEVVLDLGRVGFRTVTLDRSGGDFALSINGVKTFCRGATWTPLDCVSLNATAADYVNAVEQVRAAGMNMLRVAGPFVYETDAFLDLCDASGILLWQDFMFANMDYPAEDPDFAANVDREAAQQLTRFQARPSLALLCGNSEGAQQAAMSGAPRERWAPALFEKTLAAHAHEYCPDVPYCPSSAHGGDFPFSAAAGVTSYYGVGAYLQPLADARRSELKFASECLAFANVPETETLAQVADRALHFNQPRWKDRVPRDLGAGWDFDDVRDQYLQRLFRLDPASLRYAEQDRYLRLSRATSGEAMLGAFAEWRRARSVCSGALVLFLRDLWPGAGWGVVDSTGLPKAAYYYLKRALRDTALFVTDEGTNGLSLHCANDSPQPLSGQLQLELFKSSESVGRPVTRSVSIEARSVLELNATQLFDGFVDLSYVYRFGPPSYDVLRVAFVSQPGGDSLEAFHFPLGLPNAQLDVGLSASARQLDDRVEVDIASQSFAQAVHIEAPGYVPDDQYFHMAPRSRRTVRLRPRSGNVIGPFEGTVHALNAVTACRIGLTG
jgi:beta-mannosidase